MIFSRSGYQKGLLGFCDICYNIVNADKELYYKCQNCEDFVACRQCVLSNRHKNHPAHHSFVISSDSPDYAWIHMNLGIICDICFQNNFAGKRYQCQSCLPLISFDVCSSCLPNVGSFHPKHKFAFVPNASKIHANRIILATRAITLLKNGGSNSYDRDDATGWRMSDAQRVLAVDTLELQKRISAVSTNSLSGLSSTESNMDHSINTSLHNSSQTLINKSMETYLKNLQEGISSLSVSQPTEGRLGTHTLPDYSADLALSHWLQDFSEERRKKIEEEEEDRKREEAEQERIREKIIRDKVIRDKVIRDKVIRDKVIRDKVIRDKVIHEKIVKKAYEDKYYADKSYADKRINEQYQTANRIAQERRTQQQIENERVAQASRMAVIRQEQIRQDVIRQEQIRQDVIRQEQIQQDVIRQEQIREAAIRQQRR